VLTVTVVSFMVGLVGQTWKGQKLSLRSFVSQNVPLAAQEPHLVHSPLRAVGAYEGSNVGAVGAEDVGTGVGFALGNAVGGAVGFADGTGVGPKVGAGVGGGKKTLGLASFKMATFALHAPLSLHPSWM
jgi:hypothetical protein